MDPRYNQLVYVFLFALVTAVALMHRSTDLDVINLFLYILRILNDSQRD